MFNRSLIFFLALVLVQNSFGQRNTVEISDFYGKKVKFSGFVLNSEKELRIKAVGAGGEKEVRRITNFHEDKFNMFAYGWIINSKTREMVWRMTIDNTEQSKWSDWNREFDGTVSLEKGQYEVYFSTVEPLYFSLDGGFLTFGKLMKKLFSEEDDWEEQSDQWKIEISGVDEVLNDKDIKKDISRLKESAILNLTRLKDGERESGGFSISKPLNLSIYALGEGFEGKMYDMAWIIDANTRRKVWVMKEYDSEYAGGAEKNRFVREDISLDAGDYLVYYKLDDSHSSQEWNANPPYDPSFWGITIWPKEKSISPSDIKKYSEVKQEAIVSITRVGDYAYKEVGLEISKPTRIRIYAMGEGRDNDMYDYGWISNASNGRIVWKMRYQDTKHAGGASKNRLFDDVIKLDTGKYLVHYQSDDSHSYEDWNMRRPQEPENWGISIFVLGDKDAAKRINRQKIRNENILARLIHIGDDENVRKDFTLQKTSRVRIYCLGEGDWDEMYDYGWIKNMDTNQTVWKMRYKKTVHAGGAEKNRKIDTEITLDPGHYRVYYRSDDSHSSYDWNSRAPHDERNWGITVYRLSD